MVDIDIIKERREKMVREVAEDRLGKSLKRRSPGVSRVRAFARELKLDGLRLAGALVGTAGTKKGKRTP